jgi:hypothetical protein
MTPPPGNRFSVAQFLLWMGVVSVLFGIHGQDLALFRDAQQSLHPWMTPEGARRHDLETGINFGILCVCIPFMALAILGLGQWVLRRGLDRFPVQPGHWLLVALGWHVLAGEVVVAFVLAVSRRDPEAMVMAYFRHHWLLSAVDFAGLALSLATLCWAVYRRPDSRTWTAAMALLALALLILVIRDAGFLVDTSLPMAKHPLWPTLFRLSLVTYAAGVAAMFAACIRDRMQGVRRDLFHLAGVAVVIVVMILQIRPYIGQEILRMLD